jgi:hypothetical protein
MVLNPTSVDIVKVDCYIDANYASLWGVEDKQGPLCIKSRTGYDIIINDCPVYGSSKLQSDIATRIIESEYNPLSMAMCEVIPLLCLTKEICFGESGGILEEQE